MRVGGIILYILLAPFSLLAALLLPIYILISPRMAKPAMRCFDELANAFWFGGSAYESLSSHAWRARDKWWAKCIITLTDVLEKGHCEVANSKEQPIVTFVENQP